MGLSCECPEWDGDLASWLYYEPEDFSTLQTKKRQRCKSCKSLIDIGATVIKFTRFRYPSEFECDNKIYRDEASEIPLATWYFCESCADQYFNLTSLGFCVKPDDNVMDLLEKYQDEYVR